MTHGFDDQGRKYDYRGNLRDWWTRSDDKRFRAKTGPLIEQFASYPVLDGKRLDGRLTLGENIADLGGMCIAFAALKNSLKGKAPKKIDGLTPEQRFFFAHVQAWKTRMRPEYQKMLLKIDPHSPARYRVNGPLSNMPEFAQAFGLEEGCPMVRSKRVKIW
jgi:putative endopeptidase